MNMRQHKLIRAAQMSDVLCNRYWQGVIDRALTPTAEEMAHQKELDEDRSKDFWSEMKVEAWIDSLLALVEPEAAVQVYTVARKKDGEIVGTFDTIEQAQEQIDKAKKAKKAALVMV